ncbi:TrmH family RNA methyltransferase [Bacteroidota bacterium]
MITRNEIKYYNSLLKKKYRKQENKFLVEGKKSVLEGINSKYNCEIILLTKKFLNGEAGYIKKIKSSGVRIETINSTDFRWVSDTKSPEGISAVFNTPKPAITIDKLTDPIIIYLENISDPGNVGTIIRNCDWFGIKNILLSKDSVEIYNPKVVRASMGSIFHNNIYSNITIPNLSGLKETGYEFICSDIKGQSIFNYVKGDKIILFLSNESNGPSKELLSVVDKSLTIPGKGKADSLNVASSSAILLAELTK